MDEAGRVRGHQRLGDVDGDAEGLVERQRPRRRRAASVSPSTSSITR